MKLIDILVRELPKRDCLPISTLAITQDEDGSVCLWEKEGAFSVDGSWKHPSGTGLLRYLCNENAMEPAEDRANAIVTRDQYEAALAASKPEWNGEGLPPVGCECEIAASTPYLNIKHPEGAVVKIYSHFTDDRGVELAAFVDAAGKVGGVCTAKCFRPLRTESDKKRDEAVKAMVHHKNDPVDVTENCYHAIYDAIAAGKVPGIRID